VVLHVALQIFNVVRMECLKTKEMGYTIAEAWIAEGFVQWVVAQILWGYNITLPLKPYSSKK